MPTSRTNVRQTIPNMDVAIGSSVYHWDMVYYEPQKSLGASKKGL